MLSDPGFCVDQPQKIGCIPWLHPRISPRHPLPCHVMKRRPPCHKKSRTTTGPPAALRSGRNQGGRVPPVQTAWPMASGPGLARLRTLATTGLAKWRPSAAETDQPSVTAVNGVTDGNSKQSVPSAGAVSDHLPPHPMVGLSHKPKTRAGALRVQQAPP